MNTARARSGCASLQLPRRSSHCLSAWRNSRTISCQRDGSANSPRARTALVVSRICAGGGIGVTRTAMRIISDRGDGAALGFAGHGAAEHFDVEALFTDAHIVVKQNGRDDEQR